MTTTVVNMKCDSYDIRIDRKTALGNRHQIGRDGNRATVIEKHLRDWRQMLESTENREWAIDQLKRMKGKRLGCHCKPLACHGDNYVKLIGEFCP